MTPPNTDYKINFYGDVSRPTRENAEATCKRVKQYINLPEFFEGLEIHIGTNFNKIEY